MTSIANEGLWPFALKLYHYDGVSPACLTLQTLRGADVNLVLFAAWMGARGHALNAEEVARAHERVAAWHAEIVKPLRAVRMRMKEGPVPAPSPRTEEARTKLKAVEIECEKIELEVLDAYGTDLGSGSDTSAIRANIEALLGIDPATPDETTVAVTHIVEAAGDLSRGDTSARRGG